MADREFSYQDIRAVLSMCAFSCAFLLCHTQALHRRALSSFELARCHTTPLRLDFDHDLHMVSLRNDQLLLPEQPIVTTP